MYQSIPSVTSPHRQQPSKFQQLSNPSRLGNFFGQIPGGGASLGSLILINFTLFDHFKTSVINLPLTVYTEHRFINEKYVKTLTCISYWLILRSNALPWSNLCPLVKFWSNAPGLPGGAIVGISLDELLSNYSFHSNWDVFGSGGILLFVNAMPTPKSCNYTRKSNQDRISKSTYFM